MGLSKRGAAAWGIVLLLVGGCGDPDRERAEELFRQAREIHRRGEGDEEQRRQQIIARLKQAIDLAPGLHPARVSYALLLADSGDYKAALRQVHRVPFGEPRKARVVALASAGLFQLKRDPTLVDDVLGALSEAGGSLTAADRFTIARNLCEVPPGRIPGPVDAKALRAGIALLQELTAPGREVPGDYRAYLGLALLKQGRRAEAAACFERALADPDLSQRDQIARGLQALRAELEGK